MTKSPVTVNGRTYNWPKRTLVVICLDGSEPAYTDEARKRGLMPNLERLIQKGGEIGKRLDFLIQELHREANTLGSKSAALELTHISVDMKVLIEQMREQVQNIE